MMTSLFKLHLLRFKCINRLLFLISFVNACTSAVSSLSLRSPAFSLPTLDWVYWMLLSERSSSTRVRDSDKANTTLI